MVMRMREMKDSGIEWVGAIPQEWNVSKLKYSIICRDSERIPVDKNLRVDGPYPYWGAGSIMDYVNDYIFDDDLVLLGEDGAPFFEWRRDVAHHIKGKCWINNHIHVLQAKSGVVSNSFLTHFLNIVDYKSYINGAILNKLTQGNMMEIALCLPSLQEQDSIVKFLDSKCAEIDALSTDIQSEIDTLEAYKQSKLFDTIMHGVGHNSFVQTNSDVWTSIPAGWKLVDVKYIFEIVKRIAGKEGFDIIAITQQGLKVKDISSNEGQLASDYSGYQFVYPGDFAMNHMDLLTGWVDLSDKFGVTSPDYRVFRLRYPDAYDRKYYKFVMQCCYMNRIFYTLGQGVSNLGRWRLQTSAFNNFKVPVPPYEEQVRLGDYLEIEISQINEIIAQKQEQMAVLADYKKSIIYEYVTGKKEVPND